MIACVMLRISTPQARAFQAVALSECRTVLMRFLRDEMNDYIHDLDDTELGLFSEKVIELGHSFGFITQNAIAKFSIPCAIYGALSPLDPIYKDVFYWQTRPARLRLPEDIVAATARILDVEFSRRTGDEVIVAAADIALAAPPTRTLPAVLMRAFRERFDRISEDELAMHLDLSAQCADSLGLRECDHINYYQKIALLLGARFGIDPLYPWANRALGAGAASAVRIRTLKVSVQHFIKASKWRLT